MGKFLLKDRNLELSVVDILSFSIFDKSVSVKRVSYDQ